MNCKTFDKLPSGEIYIMGNQSADLDSCVSACSLSALLSTGNRNIRAIPLIQGDRRDLRLKPEIPSLFTRAGIDMTEILFTSELEESGLKEKNVILIDHNHPERDDYTFKVIGIVDHHRESGLFRHLPLKDIRTCGSCSTIISEYWRQCTGMVPYSQRLLLAGAIEVDTGSLSPEWGKTTELDTEQYHFLKEGLSGEDGSFLSALLEVKNDLGHLDMADHLKRDYKTFPLASLQGGISSVPLSITQFFSKEFFEPPKVDAFCRERCSRFLLILHSRGNPLQRELSLYCPELPEGTNPAETRMNRSLKALDTEFIGTERRSEQSWHHYRLNDPRTSRKVLVPLLLDQLG